MGIYRYADYWETLSPVVSVWVLRAFSLIFMEVYGRCYEE